MIGGKRGGRTRKESEGREGASKANFVLKGFVIVYYKHVRDVLMCRYVAFTFFLELLFCGLFELLQCL